MLFRSVLARRRGNALAVAALVAIAILPWRVAAVVVGRGVAAVLAGRAAAVVVGRGVAAILVWRVAAVGGIRRASGRERV